MVRARGVVPVAATGHVGGPPEPFRNESWRVPPAALRLGRRSTVFSLFAVSGFSGFSHLG